MLLSSQTSSNIKIYGVLNIYINNLFDYHFHKICGERDLQSNCFCKQQNTVIFHLTSLLVLSARLHLSGITCFGKICVVE
jgi:hypothetical protein